MNDARLLILVDLVGLCALGTLCILMFGMYALMVEWERRDKKNR